jgi:hypothetical protein
VSVPFTDPGIPLQIIDGAWTNGHLRFDLAGEDRWAVRLATTSREALPVGYVQWFGLWGHYALRTSMMGATLAPECLDDIAQFCRDRGAERAAARIKGTQ